MADSFAPALLINTVVHLCNPFAWLVIGLILYGFFKKKVSVLFKINLVILYGIYFVTNLYLSFFVGGMAGGAPGVPESYGAVLVTFILSILTIVGIGLLYILVKR